MPELKITVDRDEDPGIVANEFANAINRLAAGIVVKCLNPDGEDSQEWLIETTEERLNA